MFDGSGIAADDREMHTSNACTTSCPVISLVLCFDAVPLFLLPVPGCDYHGLLLEITYYSVRTYILCRSVAVCIYSSSRSQKKRRIYHAERLYREKVGVYNFNRVQRLPLTIESCSCFGRCEGSLYSSLYCIHEKCRSRCCTYCSTHHVLIG